MLQSLSIIGIGAFGEFMLRHLAPFFTITVFDPFADTSAICNTYNVQNASTITQAAQSDIIIIATPVKTIHQICEDIAPHLSEGQLVMDVASVKSQPAETMQATLPDYVDLIGLHPLFGPQSGKYGIHNQNIALVNLRGQRASGVTQFLEGTLHLNVIPCTAAEHDQQMAYVQGLTHMIGRIMRMMDIPEITQETKTFSLLRQMSDLVKNDSDALFKAIQTDNPYVENTKEQFFTAVKDLEDSLKES